ncbi:MAG: NTP transferase domain-containing protein [Acidimicrobiia bacterium]
MTRVRPAGVLLTGGTSRRLGADKATLILDGETLSARAAGLLATRCGSAIEVGPGHTTLPAVREVPPGAGPLAALVAGVQALGGIAAVESVILLACDLPGVAPALDALVDAPPAALTIAVDHEGRRQYVCARYGPAALERAVTLLTTGERSLHALVTSLAPQAIAEVRGFAPDVLADIDHPDDARRAGIELPPVASAP